MTIHVTPKEAEQQFPQLFSQVLQGEEIIISVDGREIAKLIPSSASPSDLYSPNKDIRVPGIDEGRFVVPDDFDDPLPTDILKAFERES